MRNPPPSPTALKTSISEDAIDQLFRQARTHSAWLAEPVPAEIVINAQFSPGVETAKDILARMEELWRIAKQA